MTDLGLRPNLEALILILDGVCKIEADSDALDTSKPTFRVVWSFDRSRLPESWQTPKPTHMLEAIIEHLHLWRAQRIREEQWVSKEEKMGSSIDALMAHYTEELKKSSKATPQNIVTRMQSRLFTDTILRLQELKERRASGGVYSQTESRREKARKAWAEDEFEGPKREEQQRKEHAKANPYEDFWSDYFAGGDAEEIFKRYKSHWGTWGSTGDYTQQKTPFRKEGEGKRPWHQVLDVPANASKAQIQKAYRTLAAKYHPDRYKEKDGHEKMAEINTARDTGLEGL